MNVPARNPILNRVDLRQLRPTQRTAGFAEIAVKSAEWTRQGKKQRKQTLHSHVFPAVRGLDKAFYIVDHHHLGLALLEHKVEEVWVAQLDDLSWLAPQTFWRTLEFHSWCHPYDQRGRRQDYRDMPRRLTELKDDPYRSLAGFVRRAGGYAKDTVPFAEFLWADYFRERVDTGKGHADYNRATRQALKLARSNEARYLPGWSGKIWS